MKSLVPYRKNIDSIDGKIIALLQSRAENIKKIADVKNSMGQQVYDPAREAEIIRNIKTAKKGKFPPGAIESIYNEIFSASRMLQRKVSVAFLGPVASYSHEAAMKRFGSQTEYIPVNSIKEVFETVEKGGADYGCVPIENSTEGAVNYSLDTFADSELKIITETILEIKHCLLTNEKSFKDIKRLYVHPQTLGQCRGWIESNLPGVELKEAQSNSKAAQTAAGQKGAAAIAGRLAAKVYGIRIAAESIQDMSDNVTRFFVLGTGSCRKTGDDKTSIMVSIKDKVGALYSLLKPFTKYGLNMTSIESRPSKKKAWDYLFFVDFTGHKDDVRVKKTLAEIEKNCGAVKILGSYPKF
jgi:chorismate mutase/prephenate dehydratase